MKKNNYVFFWGGCFSQWYPSKFVIDNVEYCCAEQYMMAKKALLFEDIDSFNKIMSTKNPRKQKEFGRAVKNFDVEKWNAVCRDYVYDGNYAKFTQNSALLRELLSYKTEIFVEASPEDKLYGIGLSADDPRSWDKKTWLGSNWLGETITKVRDELINAEYASVNKTEEIIMINSLLLKLCGSDFNKNISIEDNILNIYGPELLFKVGDKLQKIASEHVSDSLK